MNMQNSEWRRSAAAIFLGIIVVLALVIGGLSLLFGGNNTNSVVQTGVFIVGTTALLLIILTLLPNLRKVDFINKNGVTGETVFHFDTYRQTMVGKVPEKLQPKDFTIEEKAISSDLKKILLTGFTRENCQKCLDLLRKNESVVQKSWAHKLNRARYLRGIGETEQARKLVYHVLDAYSSAREAVGMCYEVLSWFEELEYNDGGQVEQRLLELRIDYINKGLEFYPEYYQLWINAFEAAFLQKNAGKALVYLNKLIRVDKGVAQRYFIDNPMTAEIMELSSKLENKIGKLIKGEKTVQKFELIKVQNLILSLTIALSLVTLPNAAGMSAKAISKEGTSTTAKAASKEGTSTTFAKATSKEGTSTTFA